ncbi:MAG: DUF2971 domain-containing protein [Acidobacteria bacterium]|nr:DUF2971 domain-containing protein [Acidobacteriota bacterium]
MNVKEILTREPRERLYHYTTPQGLLGIVKKREIWATHTQYLNDIREFSHAVAMAEQELQAMAKSSEYTELRPVLHRMKESLEGVESVNVCVASFSEEGDSLPQWRAYGGETAGFAVGFSGQFLQSVLGDKSWLVPCQYDDNEQRRIIRTLIEDVLTEGQNSQREGDDGDPPISSFRVYLMRYAPILKHRSFRDEKEWRILSWPLDCTSDRFCYRVGRSMLIPYYRMPLETDSTPFRMEEIIVGPTPHTKQSIRSVRSLLLKHGLKQTQVVESATPYRSW